MCRRDPAGTRKSVKTACESRAANYLGHRAASPAEANIGVPHSCPWCDNVFGSKQALSVHAFRAHGMCRTARFYVDADATCYACLRRFASRGRCIEHLANHSPACLTIACSRFDMLSRERVAQLDEIDRELIRTARKAGYLRHGAGVPAIRLQGPLMADDLNTVHLE